MIRPRLPSAADVAAAKAAKRVANTNLFQAGAQCGPPAAASAASASGTNTPSASGTQAGHASAGGPAHIAATSSASAPVGPGAPVQAPVPPHHAVTVPSTIASAAIARKETAAAVASSTNPNAIIVAKCQQGNPILKAIHNVPWQYGETSADYVLSDTTCALFLSLRYHRLHPNYLARRLRELSNAFSLRLVLLLVDSDDSEGPVLEVTHAAMRHECTALLAWSVAEAARYLETLRAYARKPADLIKERSDGAFVSQLAECLTLVRPVNKTDVATLHGTFGSLSNIMHASQQQLATCPGLGDRKVRRLRETFVAPFVPHSAKGRSATCTGSASKSVSACTVAPLSEQGAEESADQHELDDV